jgi:hypothetical protein
MDIPSMTKDSQYLKEITYSHEYATLNKRVPFRRDLQQLQKTAW